MTAKSYQNCRSALAESRCHIHNALKNSPKTPNLSSNNPQAQWTWSSCHGLAICSPSLFWKFAQLVPYSRWCSVGRALHLQTYANHSSTAQQPRSNIASHHYPRMPPSHLYASCTCWRRPSSFHAETQTCRHNWGQPGPQKKTSGMAAWGSMTYLVVVCVVCPHQHRTYSCGMSVWST